MAIDDGIMRKARELRCKVDESTLKKYAFRSVRVDCPGSSLLYHVEERPRPHIAGDFYFDGVFLPFGGHSADMLQYERDLAEKGCTITHGVDTGELPWGTLGTQVEIRCPAALLRKIPDMMDYFEEVSELHLKLTVDRMLGLTDVGKKDWMRSWR